MFSRRRGPRAHPGGRPVRDRPSVTPCEPGTRPSKRYEGGVRFCPGRQKSGARRPSQDHAPVALSNVCGCQSHRLFSQAHAQSRRGSGRSALCLCLRQRSSEHEARVHFGWGKRAVLQCHWMLTVKTCLPLLLTKQRVVPHQTPRTCVMPYVASSACCAAHTVV